MKLQYIAGSIASAQFHSGAIAALRPYERGATDDTHLYGLIEKRSNSGTRACIVEVSRELRNDLDQGYFPGGISARFIQQANHSWLVVFDANDILASAYMRMTDEDVQRLMSDGFGTER